MLYSPCNDPSAASNTVSAQCQNMDTKLNAESHGKEPVSKDVCVNM